MLRSILFIFMGAMLFSCSDPCDDVNCGANGSCDEESGACICDDWFEGSSCETETKAKFLGTWNSTSGCTLGASGNSDPAWVVATAANSNAFILQSIDVFDNIIINATLESDNQAIITPFMLGETSFTGSISFINESTMAMILNFENSTQDVTCNYAMSK